MLFVQIRFIVFFLVIPATTGRCGEIRSCDEGGRALSCKTTDTVNTEIVLKRVPLEGGRGPCLPQAAAFL